jgi:hypothetical protein
LQFGRASLGVAVVCTGHVCSSSLNFIKYLYFLLLAFSAYHLDAAQESTVDEATLALQTLLKPDDGWHDHTMK